MTCPRAYLAIPVSLEDCVWDASEGASGKAEVLSDPLLALILTEESDTKVLFSMLERRDSL